MRILFAILSLLVGVFLVYGGYRMARILIPLLGFIAGLSIGGAITADMTGDAFLGTVLGVIIALSLGLVLAALSYFSYSLAIIVLAGGLGYWLGSGFVLLLGFSPGFLSAVVGFALGVFVGILALVSNAPKYVLIVLTSVVGAVATVGGVLLLFNQVPLELYSYTTARIAISHSFIWATLSLALFVTGLIAQAMSTNDYTLEEWSYDDTTKHMHTPTTHPSGVH